MQVQSDDVPDLYNCSLCEPRAMDRERARALQQQRILDEQATNLKAAAAPPPVSASKSRKKPQTPVVSSVSDLTGTNPPPTSTKSRRKVKKPAERTPSTTPAALPPAPSTQEASLLAEVAADSSSAADNDRAAPSEAWSSEFTPIEENICFSDVVRQRLVEYCEAQTAAILLHSNYPIAKTPLDEVSNPSLGIIINPGSPQNTRKDFGHPVDYTSVPSDKEFSFISGDCEAIPLIGASLTAFASSIAVRAVADLAQISSCTNAGLTANGIGNLSSTYLRPTTYGLFCDTEKIHRAQMICELLGELQDIDQYRRSMVNQYNRLGIPKPGVFFLPSPLSIAIDSRQWGTAARFARTGMFSLSATIETCSDS